MRKSRFFILPFAISGLLFLGACDEYVQGVDPLINVVEDDLLDEEANLPFLSNGVRVRFADTHDFLGVLSDGLSDLFEFDQSVNSATFPTFEQLDMGLIDLDNNSVDGGFRRLGELRFFADNLVERAAALDAGAEEVVDALFVGKFSGAMARYFYAANFGLSETVGGGVIDGGPFIPSADLYASAITLWTASLAHTTDANVIASINSLIARAHLFNGNYASAATAAMLGLSDGMDGLESEYSSVSTNYYYQQAGKGRTQFVVANRFIDYVTADANEASRVIIDTLRSNAIPDSLRSYQVKYPLSSTPLPVITWQENTLMLAELALRGQATGTPLDLVNDVRDSHGIADLTAVDLDVIYEERDKELFCLGLRLVDQRRFEGELTMTTWHLGAGTWKYMPIPENERLRNDNID